MFFKNGPFLMGGKNTRPVCVLVPLSSFVCAAAILALVPKPTIPISTQIMICCFIHAVYGVNNTASVYCLTTLVEV